MKLSKLKIMEISNHLNYLAVDKNYNQGLRVNMLKYSML
jgi:hypothetical protein